MSENGFYYIEKDISTPSSDKASGKNKKKNRKTNRSDSSSEIVVQDNGFLSIQAFDASVTDLIMEAAEKLQVNYFMYEKPEEDVTTLVVNNIAFDDLLTKY